MITRRKVRTHLLHDKVLAASDILLVSVHDGLQEVQIGGVPPASLDAVDEVRHHLLVRLVSAQGGVVFKYRAHGLSFTDLGQKRRKYYIASLFSL